MDYQKLDAPLVSALSESPHGEENVWEVFIHLTHRPNPSQIAFLHRLGVTANSGNEIVSARVSKPVMDELTSQPWIRVLKLSRKLRPLSDEANPENQAR